MSQVTAAPAALRISGVAKRFRKLQVLESVDSVLPEGRVTAIVGPNAAGKSPLIKCVLGLVRPDAGRIEVFGEPVGTDPAYRTRIGYMPQGAPFPENLTGHEVLRLVRSLRPGVTEVDDDLIHRFALAPELGKPIRTLSGGTRQKLNAVVAFLFRPSLVILDEPTAGLDPLAKNRSEAMRSIEEAARKIRNGASAFLYAEGTRTLDGKLQPFKRGAFNLAVRSGVPVVPLTINGTYTILPKHSLGINPGVVELVLDDPIPVDPRGGKEEEIRVMGRVHASIARTYKDQ